MRRKPGNGKRETANVTLALALGAVAFLFAGADAALAADEKTAPDVGWVRLPLSEYDRLLRAVRRPPKAPLDAAITSTASILEAEGSAPRLSTSLELVSLSDKPQVVPLPDLGVLYGADSGDGAAVEVSETGGISIRLARRGRYAVRLRSVLARVERSGSVVLTWGVPDSPSNRFTASLPGGHESVTLSGGNVEVRSSATGPVRVTGTLRRGETVRLAYAVAAARAPEERLLASASESRLYRLGEKSLGVASRLRIEVLRGTLRSFSVDADPDFTVTSAWAADNTVTSFERDPGKPGRLVLTLARGVTGGSTEIFWLLERRAAESRDEIALPDVGLPDFLRGETAVAVTSPRPLVLEEGKGRREGYERIDESDLPPELKEMADSTVLLALRRIGSGAPVLSVQVLSFPDAAGIGGVIDRGRILTIATRDGMRIDRWQLELQTRESLIRLPLPDHAELWSLQVDGKPARPLTEAGRLVVPLGRGEKAARVRRIEIVLATPGAIVVSGRGTRRIEMPKLPLPMTHAEWDLLLPETSQYRYAGGTVVPIPVEPEAMSISAAPVAGGVEGGVPGGVAGRTSANNAFAVDKVEISGSGRLSGRALDARGAALPGATVTIVRQEGGFQQSRASDSQGFFAFTGVPAGTYRVRGDLSGFQANERVLSMSEGSNLGADLKLNMAAAMEAITVSAEAPLLDVRKSYSGISVRTDADAGVRDSPARREAAKESNLVRQVLSDEERASLQRTSETGVASIVVELPSEGKRLHFEGNLLVDEAATLELDVRPAKRGLFR